MISMKRYVQYIGMLLVILMVTGNAWGAALPKAGALDNNGTYTLSANQTQTGTLTVANGVKAFIDLNGKTLNGNALQIFNIAAGGTLTITNGTITNGKAANGGCGIISGTLSLGNVTVMNCTSTNDGGAFYVNASGALTMTNCILENNTAARHGGAICSASTANTLIINGSTKLRYNSAKNYGGAIYARTLKIAGNSVNDPVVIANNEATFLSGEEPIFTLNSKGNWTSNNNGRGGGVFIPTSSNATEPFADMNCDIDYCEIRDNYAAIDGGGIYSGINTTIDNSKILGNKAMSSEKRIDDTWKAALNAGRGGGFYFTGYYNSETSVERKPQFTLTDTDVLNNECMYYGGGGQLTTRAVLTVKGTTKINNNKAVLHGAGGLHLTADVTLFFNSGQINNNEAYTVGGGIHTSYGCTLHLNGGTISGNKANQRGGGVHVNTGGNLTLAGTIITDNKVYKGKDMAYATVVKNTDRTYAYDANSLDYKKVGESSYKYEDDDDNKYLVNTGLGGGVLIDSGTFTMNSGELSGNKAQVAGGGLCLVMIRISDSVTDFERLNVVNFTLNDGEIYNNTTAGNGAGVYIMDNKIPAMLKELFESSIPDAIKNSEKYTALTTGKPSSTIVKGTLYGNVAQQSGGALYMEAGNLTVATAGSGNLYNNTATTNGGAIYIGDGNVTVDGALNIGVDGANTAGNDGGAIYVGQGDFTVNGIITANNNQATAGNGGGIYLGDGTFTVGNNGVINIGNSGQPNKALNGNGGGIYCEGTFNVHGKIEVVSNIAQNGGGICVTNGHVSIARDTGIKRSVFRDNVASNLGGGLYVTTETTANVVFAGGSFINNQANYGGGACMNGNITLSISSSFENNRAYNGGAIYMMNGVNMTFGEGLIRANYALQDLDNTDNESVTKIVTAGGASFDATTGKVKLGKNEIYGFGGAIFMDNSTTFEVQNGITSFGLYNNKADCGADDIFVNGNGTKITLPKVSTMELTGFDVPGDLYWVEDYPTDATDSPRINGKDPVRYDDALEIVLDMASFNAETLHEIENKYLCVTLGYELVFVNLTKQGLQENDDITFIISYWDDKDTADTSDDEYKAYRKVILTGVANAADITKTVAIPAGQWKLEESGWGWKYNEPIYKRGEVDITWPITITKETDNVITIINTLKSSVEGSPYQGIQEFEHRVHNILKP